MQRRVQTLEMDILLLQCVQYIDDMPRRTAQIGQTDDNQGIPRDKVIQQPGKARQRGFRTTRHIMDDVATAGGLELAHRSDKVFAFVCKPEIPRFSHGRACHG